MPCFHPRSGWRSKTVNPATGKRSIVFNVRDGYCDLPVTFNCGQCIGCRLERSRQWAIRCVHEASLYERNCFITLTYAPAFLPRGGSLDYRDFQLFFKRFRKRFGDGIRFFMCGEYGEKRGRPHYHCCVFNFDFPDKEVCRRDERGYLVWRSNALEELWPSGRSEIGTLNFESAAYCARYILKKQTGEAAHLHYELIDDRGEIFDRVPEFTHMSLKPGIGRGWFDRFSSDVYPEDFVVLQRPGSVSIKCRAPKYYDRIFELESPEESYIVKMNRRFDALERKDEDPRLLEREYCLSLKLKQLKRGYEDGS